MSDGSGIVHWLGVAVASFGAVLVALGLASYLFGTPAFDRNPTWIGMVCLLLGGGVLSGRKSREPGVEGDVD